MTSTSDEKWRPFNCYFQSREQVVVRPGQIRRTGWVIKILGAQVGQFLLGCKCPVSLIIFVQEQDPLGDLPAAFFLQNVLQLYQQRWVIFRVVSLALWKTINENYAVLIPKIEARTFQRIFAIRNFLGRGGLSRYAPTLLTVALSPSHSDTTRFRPWSPIASDRKSLGSRWKNYKSFSDAWHRWLFYQRSEISGPTSRRASACSNQMIDPISSREMPRCSAIDLAEIRRSSKISLWIWSVISGVVTVLRRPWQEASQVGN